MEDERWQGLAALGQPKFSSLFPLPSSIFANLMRWRPFTWLLLSVFCFVAAVYFWRLGDQWAAKKAQTPPAQPTNQLKPKEPAPQPQSHSPAASMVLLSQGTLNALPTGHQSPTTNHQSLLQYRLSNTTRT